METGEILLGISIALIAGLISNRIIKLINLPNVTGYLLVGILLGPYFFSLFDNNLTGVISEEMVESFGIIVDIAFILVLGYFIIFMLEHHTKNPAP